MSATNGATATVKDETPVPLNVGAVYRDGKWESLEWAAGWDDLLRRFDEPREIVHETLTFRYSIDGKTDYYAMFDLAVDVDIEHVYLVNNAADFLYALKDLVPLANELRRAYDYSGMIEGTRERHKYNGKTETKYLHERHPQSLYVNLARIADALENRDV